MNIQILNIKTGTIRINKQLTYTKTLQMALHIPSMVTYIKPNPGFIATQTPLPDSRQDFWAMVAEQTSSAIVYFNDCQVGLCVLLICVNSNSE